MKHFYRILPVVMALMLVFTGVEKKGSFDITAGGTSKGGDVPVVTGLAAYHSDSGTGKGGDVPVTPGIRAKASLDIDAGGVGKVSMQ